MNANQIHKQKVLEFWNRFGGWKAGMIGHNSFSKSEKLAALIAFSEIKIEYHKQQPLKNRREKFDEIKSQLCRRKIGSPCFVCGENGFVRHHIIQLQNGGINSRRNLVILCDPCHCEVHPWLKLSETL